MKSQLHEQWEEVYGILGMNNAWEGFYRSISPIKFLPQEGLWLIPVLAGVTAHLIFTGFETKGVRINDPIGLAERRDLAPVENPFFVCTDAKVNLPIVRMTGKAESFWGMMSIQEYFLLDLWHLVAHGSCLDDSSVTVLSGTRLDGHKIPATYYSRKNKVVEIGWLTGEVTGRFAPRLVYSL